MIFRSTNNVFNEEFAKLMTDKFEMSMMGELKLFLGFEIKQLLSGTFFNQSKYIQDMLKRFDMKGTNGIGTPMALKFQLDLGPNGKPVDQKLYRSMIGDGGVDGGDDDDDDGDDVQLDDDGDGVDSSPPGGNFPGGFRPPESSFSLSGSPRRRGGRNSFVRYPLWLRSSGTKEYAKKRRLRLWGPPNNMVAARQAKAAPPIVWAHLGSSCPLRLSSLS
ncbi:hypothetical protein QYE76_033559 [Lolium multiflorum]|uniref:Reverse transcriptase Ty1/copia-type domain-containing protein n=1 Tax=Lolium multiflorum TaxID=4521 RepID=A0AAD8QVW3_LOLMU|nr:hypothetical protein QYE76_033559 [Lolium multiflorum]